MKKISIITTILLFSTVLLSGCVTAPKKITHTESGKPEVIINTDSVDNIKTALISKMLKSNYQLIRDTQYIMEFKRPANFNENLNASLSIGNAYSSNYRVTIFTFIKTKVGIRVISSASLQAQLPGGQVNSMPLNSGNVYNIYQRMLFDLKSKLENGKEEESVDQY